MKVKVLLSILVVVAVAITSFLAGRAYTRGEMMPVVDEGVRLLANCMEDSHAMCDCPGPEECDMQATCNRDGIACCLTLARLEREGAIQRQP